MKILYVFCFIIVFVNLQAYGQQDVNGIYPNNASNDEITISIDKFDYLEGPIQVYGYVEAFKKGVPVYLSTYTSSGDLLNSINVFPTADGIFNVQMNIPINTKPGNFKIVGSYGQNGQSIDVTFNIQKTFTNYEIVIPLNSHEESSGLNFNPPTITAEAGYPVIWINKDTTVHTVVSGESSFRGHPNPNGLFESPIFRPNKEFELILDEGDYFYFCRLHPWLVGHIMVVPSTQPISVQKTEPLQKFVNLIYDAETKDGWSYTICDNCEAAIYLSADRKEGFSSVVFNLKGSNDASGPTSFFKLNFEPVNLISNDILSFWIKTKGNSDISSSINLVDSKGKTRQLLAFDPYSFSSWTLYEVPITDLKDESEFDAGSVTGFYIEISEGNTMKDKQIEILIDDIITERFVEKDDISQMEYVTVETDKNAYTISETIFVSGTVKDIERDFPVSVQVFDPTNNLVRIEQIIPNENKEFSFQIRSLGNNFDKEGTYRIVAQYGFRSYKVETSFTLLNPILVERNYRSYDIYLVGNIFYMVPIPYLEGEFDVTRLVPGGYSVILSANDLGNAKRTIEQHPLGPYHQEVDYHGFNLFLYDGTWYAIPVTESFDVDRIKDGGYSHIFTAAWIDDLKKIIDESLAPQITVEISESEFPISDDVLLEIWNERTDLQESYPEIMNGDYENLRKWAETVGWNEDPRLSLLIPEGSVPLYLQVEIEEKIEMQDDFMILILQILVVVASISILGYFVYKYFIENKKLITRKSETNP